MFDHDKEFFKPLEWSEEDERSRWNDFDDMGDDFDDMGDD